MRVAGIQVWPGRWIAVVAVVGLTGGVFFGVARTAQAEPENPPPTASAAPSSEASIAPSAVASEPCPTCPPCVYCEGKVHQGCLARYMASVGGFNCACRGSYKFPVPPQYTYHWPGMYSRSLMTAYSSPYRYPALKLPSWMAQAREDGVSPFSEAKPLTPSPGEAKPESPAHD